MDLQDFSGEMLYFDEPEPARVTELLLAASQQYRQAEDEDQGSTEGLLLEALTLAPANLGVLVGLYRFYYYRHRYGDALCIAERAMQVVAPKIEFPDSWRELDMNALGLGVLHSMALVRFYLLALKGAGYLKLRMGRFEQGLAMLRKVQELDEADRLGVSVLLEVLAANTAEVVPLAARRRQEVVA